MHLPQLELQLFWLRMFFKAALKENAKNMKEADKLWSKEFRYVLVYVERLACLLVNKH